MGKIDRMSIPILFFWMCSFLLLFAFTYWLLGFRGQGLRSSTNDWVSFPDCLYFSVVTFTSLGYGDIVPRGMGKILACGEVTLGLAFLGVFIAKLTSSKQSYHLAQLYARDAQQRLEDFSTALQRHTDECVNALESLKRNEKLARGMRRVLSDVNGTTRRIRSYIGFEIANGEFLAETPTGSQGRLMRRFTQFVGSVTDLACYPKSLHSQKSRRMARRTIELCAEIGRLVEKVSVDRAVKSDNSKLLKKCAAALEQIEIVEETVADLLKS
jgi:Ion channel